jgi:hypothetical protein
VFFEFHFKIKACELAQMSVRVGVLSSKNGSNLEDALKITAQSHLLVELWALGKTCILLKVFQMEHVSTSF